MIFDGDEAPAEIVKAMVLTFKGDTMTLSSGITIAEQENGKITFGLGDNPIEMKFSLRGSDPKQLHTDADNNGMSMICIYKFDGNQLTICVADTPGGKAPVEFTATKGTKQEVWVLKRLPQKEILPGRKKEEKAKSDEKTGKREPVSQGEKPALPKAESPPESLDEQQLHGEWLYTDYKSGAIRFIFGPGNKVHIINPDNSEDTGTYAVDWTKNPHPLDVKMSVKESYLSIVELIEPGKLRIELAVGSSPRPKTFTKEALVFRRQDATNQTIRELRQQVKDLERRLNALEADRKKSP